MAASPGTGEPHRLWETMSGQQEKWEAEGPRTLRTEEARGPLQAHPGLQKPWRADLDRAASFLAPITSTSRRQSAGGGRCAPRTFQKGWTGPLLRLALGSFWAPGDGGTSTPHCLCSPPRRGPSESTCVGVCAPMGVGARAHVSVHVGVHS